MEPGKAQCFAVKRGDSKERIDPKFFLHGGHQTLSGLFSRAFGELVVCEPEYGSGERAIPLQQSNDVKYIRITDFDDDGIAPGNEFVTAAKIESRYLLSDDDVLFARSGATAGKTFIYSSELGPSIFAGYCIRFRFDKDQVIPKFAYFYTKTSRYKSWVRSIQRPSGQPNINKEEFKSFTIPLPPLPVQQEMVKEMGKARESRRRKLEQADALLAYLDAFLLENLDLTLPPPTVNLVYSARLKDLTSRRLDAHFYRPYLRKTESAIRSLGCEIVELGSLLREPPLNGLDARTFSDDGRRYIRVQNIRPFELCFDDIKYVNAETKKNVVLSSGDVLLTRKGTFGVAVVVPADATDCLISSEVILLRLRRESLMSVDFLVAWLNSTVCQTLLFRYKSGGIMGHLTQDVVEAIPVPMADKVVQDKIATEIMHRRTEARRLREEAAQEWEIAKKRFEARLLGEELKQ